MPLAPEELSAVARSAVVASASGDDARAQSILSQLSPEDRANTERIMLRNQGIAEAVSNVTSTVGGAVSKGVDVAKSGLSRLGSATLAGLETLGDNFQRNVGEVLTDAGEGLQEVSRGLREQIDPLGVAQEELLDPITGLPQGQTSQTLQALSELTGFQSQVAPTVASPQLQDDPNLAATLTLPELPNLAVNPAVDPFAAQRQALVDAARQDGELIANQENLRRLGQGLALQQAPQISGNLLGNAVAAGQGLQGASAAPATIDPRTAQAVIPQVEVPSILPAVQTNINQRLRASGLTAEAEQRLRTQQARALKLAEEQFKQNTIRRILQQRR